MHAPSSASRPSVSGRALRPFAAPRNARISRGRPTAAAASVYEELIFGGDALLRAASWEDYLRLTRPPAPMPAPAPQPAAVPAPVPSPAQAATAAASTSGSADGKAKKSKFRSDWDAVEAGGGRGGGADYLSELGSSQMYNINVDHGQSSTYIDSLFTGTQLGLRSDIADGSLRGYDFRTYNNIVGDYYVAPRFLDAVTMHICKNFMFDLGCFDKATRVPLILGIWGEKGMGKTFQTELAFKKLGVESVVMSAGELEHEWAGTPGRLIRERYRKAADMSKVRGKLSCLLINDIDAGIGHFGNTQVTVNNQIVVGTLMNICDDPNRVSAGQDWREQEYLRRIPIIVTGNDLSRVFAPLVRDGRMSKFYWKPDRSDIVSMLWQMYKDDNLRQQDMEALLDRFPNQPLDFFGALRASTYDNQIRDWIKREVIKGEFTSDEANMKELSRRLLKRESLPMFEPVDLTLQMLVAEGARLEREQQMVNDQKLAQEYMPQMKGGGSLIGLKG